jgi:hypothetical protein
MKRVQKAREAKRRAPDAPLAADGPEMVGAPEGLESAPKVARSDHESPADAIEDTADHGLHR